LCWKEQGNEGRERAREKVGTETAEHGCKGEEEHGGQGGEKSTDEDVENDRAGDAPCVGPDGSEAEGDEGVKVTVA
jgi:hypothetical protein